ncbi:MAG: aspartate kinase [Chitinophagaceae bacterium]|nr:aspartate kinase [Chitinophagaceae bacterium]
MKVFKFGGASVSTVERIQNLPGIINNYSNDELLIIVSAMGKTTNALEKVVEAFYDKRNEDALQLFSVIKNQHITTSKYLLVTGYNACIEHLNQFFTEIEWLLHDKPVHSFDYYYDQVVCIGELLSTAIVSHYLNEKGITNTWVDVRDILKTDNNFRDANVCWEDTIENLKLIPLSIGQNSKLYLTQGFIGSTDENESTTLGREGSDYTAAIFSNILNAESLSIWKDVEGVMNADPKKFPAAQLISELNYEEVIEMAYYGAQVIHPKTIKPLQNKGIPMHVKCFLDLSLPGTIIHTKKIKDLPPIIVVKENQVMMHLHSQDFSFVGEKPMSSLYNWCASFKIRPNLIQTGAINVSICFDDKPHKIQRLAEAASEIFDVQVEKGLTLLTIRHYNEEVVNELTTGKQIVLQQKTPQTIQIVYR